MKYPILILLSLVSARCLAQQRSIVGKYNIPSATATMTFNADSTFEYNAKENRVIYWLDQLNEKGRWVRNGDTVILNPQLAKRPIIESEFKEDGASADNNLTLTFNYIKRYFDANGAVVKTDTLQMDGVEYAFNKLKNKNRVRVASHRMVRCTFAGYIPKETITNSRTITVQKPVDGLKCIYVYSFEQQGIKAFPISNPNASHLTVNVYTNYYQDGRIRQMKLLIKNKNVLYAQQNDDGSFQKDSFWMDYATKLVRQKKS